MMRQMLHLRFTEMQELSEYLKDQQKPSICTLVPGASVISKKDPNYIRLLENNNDFIKFVQQKLNGGEVVQEMMKGLQLIRDLKSPFVNKKTTGYWHYSKAAELVTSALLLAAIENSLAGTKSQRLN